MGYGFGIVGCGMISHFHCKAIAEIRGASFVGCVDFYQASAEKLAKTCAESQDLQEGFLAQQEKRMPRFTGK